MFDRGKVRIRIHGLMPERALLRIRRAGIELRNIRKETASTLLCNVSKKDLEKIFAIYPKLCYNEYGHSPYSVQPLGETGALRVWTWAKNRLGFLLGGLGFCVLSLGLNACVLDVQFVGSDVYARETLAVLESNGIRAFSPYETGKEDVICAALLRLPGVEFCSVKKSGLFLRVEMQVNEERLVPIRAGAYKSAHSGTVLSITALSGTALKSVGDTIEQGETLVGDYMLTPSGERTQVDVIARVLIACEYQAVIETEQEEIAFATAYLTAGLGEDDTITGKEITPVQNGYAVRIWYTAAERFNL